MAAVSTSEAPVGLSVSRDATRASVLIITKPSVEGCKSVTALSWKLSQLIEPRTILPERTEETSRLNM